MIVIPTKLAGVFELEIVTHADDRGWFREVFKQEAFRDQMPTAAGPDTQDIEWVQDNESFSSQVGTLRGLHWQEAPAGQAKLVRVLRGSLLDVAVDLRPGSKTFGQSTAVTLSAAEGNQLFLPTGFAHGFVTREPDTHVAYKVSAPYSPDHERTIRWNDPDLGIDWGLGETEPVLSPKDAVAPWFRDLFDRPVL